MNDDHLLAGDDARQQDGHALTVLAAAAIDSQESAAADHLPAIGRDGNVGMGWLLGLGWRRVTHGASRRPGIVTGQGFRRR